MTNRLAAVLTAAFSLFVSSTTWAQADESVTISIEESQPLSDALQSFADQTDLQVIFFADIAEGKTTSGVEGEYSVDTALDTLLADTGLSYTFIDDTAVSVQAVATSDGGDSDSKNLSLAPILMAQNQSNPARTTGNPTDKSSTGIITGKVIDVRTGANLRGAKITIEETGQWTSSDNLGRYRFVGVPEGEYTLTVSFLGYARQSETIGVRGRPVSHSFVLRGGDEIDEIVVFGQLSARAQALNEERTAENSTTIISSDFLGQFDGTTIAETLRRAPGVAFEQSAVTGDGTNVIIRGLDPDLSQVTLNGLRLPEGSGIGRSPDLGNILTESVSKVTISKTLLPSQDSYGSGGLVEIETKTPLDRPRRFASFSAQTGKREKGFADEDQYSATFSGLFGEDERLGLSGSFQYVDSESQRINYTFPFLNYGPYLPLSVGGTPITATSFIDPLSSFPFEPAISDIYPGGITTSVGGVSSTNLTSTISIAYRASEDTELMLDYSSIRVHRSNFDRETSFSSGGAYEVVPIDELGGEPRAALFGEDVFGFTGVLGGVSHKYAIQPDAESNTQVLSLRGAISLGSLTMDYSYGYTIGETETPFKGDLRFSFTGGNILDPSQIAPTAFENSRNGRLVSLFAPLTSDRAFVAPLLTQAGFDSFNDLASLRFSGASGVTNTTGENERESAKFSTRYDFEGDLLRYVEVGVHYDDSTFGNVRQDSGFSVSPLVFPGPLISSFGVSIDSENPLQALGVFDGFAILPQATAETLVRQITDLAAGNPDVSISESAATNLDLFEQTFTNEENISAYLQGRFDIGRLEIVGGARLDYIDLSARNVTRSTLFDVNGVFDFDFFERSVQLIGQSASQTALLPRLAATYRVNDELLFRAGMSKSVGRPQIQLLSAAQSIAIDLQQSAQFPGGSVTIQQGNPELSPTKTTSYDLSAEYYFDDVGQLEVSLFYKELSNLLETNASTSVGGLDLADFPDDPVFETLPSNITAVVIIPENNPNKAKIWGVEVAFEKQLGFVPDALEGLGVFFNYTYTDSEKVQPFTFFNVDTFQLETIDFDVPFSSDPEHSGTAALTYNRENIDASLSYSRQGRRLNAIRPYRLDRYNEAVETLDFRAEYRLDKLDGNWRLWVEGTNLLDDARDPSIAESIGGVGGVPKYFTGATFFGGREISIGFSATF